MARFTRRSFMKLAIASGAFLAAGEGLKSRALAGDIKVQTGRDFSPETGVERKAIPSACWQCVARDSMIGFVEDDRLVKLEGNPKSIRGKGYICARGQAGINQVYDPDRILYPMRRVGTRGSGKWKRISWEEAVSELTGRIKKLRDAGTPEKFYFHYGRMKASSSKLIGGLIKATGTGSIGNHTSVCESAKWTAQELTWGGHFDNWDIDNTKYMLIFGSNILETHTNHIPVAHRIMRAKIDRGVRMVTFDVRLSNTAAKSDEWIPIKPGTDTAVFLAMTNVILKKGLYKGKGEEFLKYCKCTEKHDDSVANKLAAMKKHYAKYTPAWAAGISGVAASTIERIAVEYATTKPAVLIAYRGPVTHYNGCDAERARQILTSLTGNIDNPGGNCKAVGAGWKSAKIPKAKTKKVKDVFDGAPKGQPESYPFPTHHASHQVLSRIKAKGPGTFDLALWYCYTPAYANGNVKENIEVLKDEKLLPFVISCDTSYGDSTHYTDMILPDATYLERYDWEDMVDPTQIGEYYIRQALVKPLGESRDFGDVMIEVCNRLGIKTDYRTKEEYVRQSVDMTPGVKEAGGWEYMKKHGVWNDGKQKYYSYKKEVSADAVRASGVIYDEQAGVYWNPEMAHVTENKGYFHSKNAYKGYIATKIGNKLIAGFKPDKVNKSGYMELWSQPLKDAGMNPLPEWIPAPEHERMGADDLILTTFKVCVQSHSRTANCKWLTEIYPENRAWINPKTAAARGIRDGDRIRVKSSVGELEIYAHVTENVHPMAVAISHHKGHWQYGRYASGNRAPMGMDDHDDENIFWSGFGAHPNWIIPNWGDRISGFQRWNDTVVKVTKA